MTNQSLQFATRAWSEIPIKNECFLAFSTEPSAVHFENRDGDEIADQMDGASSSSRLNRRVAFSGHWSYFLRAVFAVSVDTEA